LGRFLGVLGLWVLWKFTNPIAALVGLSGHLFYFLIYTLWLKRTTPQNIVIGGAAGAVPPIVGWAAVTGDLVLTPFLMFLVIFLWTPPHFWALALNRNEDYRRANIPMLPVVAGARATYIQMLIYAFLLIPVSAWLVQSTPELGLISWVGLIVLSLIFFLKVLRLTFSERTSEALKVKRAWDVFGFSLFYLALFFLITVIDASI
jgi:heme o synthase